MSASESEQEEEYEVEAIRDYRSEDSDGNDCREYLVKWKGYDSDDCTWEPKGHLTDPLVKEKIHKFKKIRQLESNSMNYDRKENRHQDSYRQSSHGETNEERRARKAAAKRKLEKLSEDRRRKKQKDDYKAMRPSKGNNAYASGSKSKTIPFKVSSDNVSAKDKAGVKSRSIDRSRPQKSEKARPSSDNAIINSIYKSNNSLNGIRPAEIPSSRISKKVKTNSYDALKNKYYAQKEGASETQTADVLDEF